MSWWALVPPAVVLLVLSVAPGAAALRFLGVRGLVAVGAGPPVTVGVLGLATILFGLLEVPWRLPVVLAALLVAVALAWLIGRTVRPMAALSDPGAPPLHLGVILVSLLAGFVLLTVPVVGTVPSADAPLQQWDGVFHLNAVVAVRETAIATPLGGLAPLYGNGTLAPYYPTGWHALLAVVPGSVPAVTNAGIVVLGIGVWLLGLLGLTREVLGPRTLPLALVPLLAATFVGYPTVQLTVLAQLSNGLSTALLPGALALVVRAVRVWQISIGGRAMVATLAALAATTGVLTAHASGLFSLAVLGGPLLAAVVLFRARRGWRSGRRVAAALTIAGLGVTVVALPVLVANLDALSAVVGFERASGYGHGRALSEVLLDRPLVSSYPGDGWQHLPVTLATLAGLVVVLHRRQHRWLGVAFVLAVALAVLAAGPEDHPLRWLAGFWYTQAGRIAPVAAVPAVVLSALALAAVVDRTRRRPAAVVVVVALMAVAGARVPLQERVVASAFVPGQLAFGTMASAEELTMMRQAGEELPNDALVVGDPFNGSALLPAVAGVDVVFPQLGASGMSEAQFVLQQRLAQIHEDPSICAALTELGATHLYQDTAEEADGAKQHERTTGMQDVDVSTGFTQVASAGTARIYLIEVCE